MSNNNVYIKNLCEQIQALSEYALLERKKVPSNVIELLKEFEDGGVDERNIDCEVLSVAYEYLSNVVYPAVPRTIWLMWKQKQSGHFFNFISLIPLVRNMIFVSIASIIILVVTSLSSYIGHTDGEGVLSRKLIDANMYNSNGFVLLINLVFLMAASAIGASFSILSKVQKYVENMTYDSRYTTVYWVQFILGIVSGLIFTQFLPEETLNNISGITVPLLALIGGFSAGLVYKMLSRFSSMFEKIISDSTQGKTNDEQSALPGYNTTLADSLQQKSLLLPNKEEGKDKKKISIESEWMNKREVVEPSDDKKEQHEEESSSSSKYFWQDPMLQNCLLEPSKKIAQGKGNDAEEEIIRVWNKFGGLLEHVCDKAGLPMASAMAVICVESGGAGFGKNGLLTIRFENHWFWKLWGKNNVTKYEQHFKFNREKRWTGHFYRKELENEWRSFHGYQEKEWNVLTIARKFDETAALSSISMGAAQIMGFNYEKIGYSTVQEMFKSLKSDERYHVLSLFDYLDESMLEALRNNEFEVFAKGYNGVGQAQRYGALIEDRFTTASKILESVV